MIRRLVPFFVAATLVAVAYGPARAQDTTCEQWRCQFQTALDTQCPCDQMSNHGRYVSCVAHVVNDLVKQGLPTNCKGKLKRCAARSVCGKDGFVTCNTTVEGVCDATAGTCMDNSTVACLTNADCATTRCSTKRDSDECLSAGGVVGTSPTCCASCTPQ